MSENDDAQGYQQNFQSLAELINQQPPETREALRRAFGAYLHDINHTIGLITGASTILQRELEDRGEDCPNPEMLAIINDAARQINRYTNLLTETLVTRIDADVTE